MLFIVTVTKKEGFAHSYFKRFQSKKFNEIEWKLFTSKINLPSSQISWNKFNHFSEINLTALTDLQNYEADKFRSHSNAVCLTNTFWKQYDTLQKYNL